MVVEYSVVTIYLLACVGIGLLASRRVLKSREEYWVAGRRIGTIVNALAIMATLASGGSIIGVMGLAYGNGIPFALALFAGAVLGFPLASILVARQLRRFGRYTITDFVSWRYPHAAVRRLVPTLIAVCFTVYIIAQMKAAGITATFLLGVPYEQAVTVATLVFVLYVSLGGMLAITWTDVAQGILMLCVLFGTGAAILYRHGSPWAIMQMAQTQSPELGGLVQQPFTSYLGSFVIWAAAIPIIPHIVMRVFTARDPHAARISLNLAMILYSIMILVALFIIVPVGKLSFPSLSDADEIFLRIMQTFPPLARSLAIAAVLAAVMSTTDALLLACSSAIGHDLLGSTIERRWGPRAGDYLNIAIVWAVGLTAMGFAYSPPRLITVFYSVAIGLLSATLLVPVVAGIWWKQANTRGALASILAGGIVYLAVEFLPGTPPLAAILFALPCSAAAMIIGGKLGPGPEREIIDAVARLHDPF